MHAWVEWAATAADHGHAEGTAPAFPQVAFSEVWSQPLSGGGLNFLVQQRCLQAGMDGNYTFTSLRSGLIRTTSRADEEAHRIASHADLGNLGSVRRHELREQLLTHNVAGMLGL